MVSVGLASDASSQVHVLLHNSGPVGVHGAQVRVLEESDHVTLASLLKSSESMRLESEFVVDSLSDGSHESLEGGSGEEGGRGLLVSLNLSESHSSWLEPSLDSSLGWGSLLLSGLGSLGHGGLGRHLGALFVLFTGDLISWHS